MSRNRITIGRDSHNDIRIDERWDTVSNLHGEISYENGKMTFTDHSSNGTVINGQKIHNNSVDIYQGDSIRLANAFDLDWIVINRFFPEQHRPTVTRNIRGGNQGVGRRTVELNTGNTSNGRMTERIDSYLQQRQQSNYEDQPTQFNFGKANEFSQSEIDEKIEKWNWGAFFCSWLWGVFNGVYWPLFIILVAAIPYIGQVCSLCLCVYLGLNGSKMAWRSGKYHSFESFLKAQRNWAIGGVIWFIITIAGSIYVLNYSLSLF